jgi:hypothetical protein
LRNTSKTFVAASIHNNIGLALTNHARYSCANGRVTAGNLSQAMIENDRVEIIPVLAKFPILISISDLIFSEINLTRTS